MEKEFEAIRDDKLRIGLLGLKRLFEANAKKMTKDEIMAFDFTFTNITNSLTELKSIKEAKPSEALKFINTLLNARLSDKHFINVANDETWLELSNIKLYILKTQELENENAEYKEALRIIKEKDVNIWYLTVSTKVKNYKDYNSFLMNDKSIRKLTEEEFELVRRVLRNEN